MTKDDLIRGLNEDLAAELSTVIRYTYEGSRCFGPFGLPLREMLSRGRLDEIGHAAFLMDVITDLGGEPVTAPRPFGKPADLKEMLELDLRLEEEAAQKYVRRAREAEALMLPELKVRLEEMAADEAGHARELRRVLKGLEAPATAYEPLAECVGHG